MQRNASMFSGGIDFTSTFDEYFCDAIFSCQTNQNLSKFESEAGFN